MERAPPAERAHGRSAAPSEDPQMTPLLALALVLIGAVPLHAQESPQALDEWIADPYHTHDGRIRLTGLRHGTYHRGYRCPSLEAAVAVVSTVTAAKKGGTTAERQRALLLRTLPKHGCAAAARGDYVPLALGPTVSLDLGFEASEDWTALRVRTPDGVEAGLVYDASVYAMD